MKVLILTSVASMIKQFNMSNIKLLVDMGHEVNVACNFTNPGNISNSDAENLKKLLEKNDVKCHQVDFSRQLTSIKQHINSIQQLKHLRNMEFDLLHCQSPIAGTLSRIIFKKEDIKIIYTAHGFHFYIGAPLTNWLLYYPLELIMSRNTNLLITINKEDYNRAQNFFADKTIYIPGIGIDINKYRDDKVDKVKKRASIGINNEDFLLISVGELNENKNHQVILKAIAKLENKMIRYVICGQGILEKDLKRLAQKLKIENQVIFLGFRNDISELLAISDLFLFPSIREGLPVSLMEAMATGLPAVCSNIRGNRDLIEHEKGGFLTKYNDKDSFAYYIDKMLNNPQLRYTFGEYNSVSVEKNSREDISEKMKNAYKLLLQRS